MVVENKFYWRSFIFTDEKKLNMDDPGGLSYSFHDLRSELKNAASSAREFFRHVVWIYLIQW